MAAHWRVGLLALATTLIWCAHYDRWTVASWSVPTTYGGDALEIFARIAAAAEGDAVPLQSQVITRLGAPHGASWNAYPSSDIVLLWGIGQLARVVGVFPAANLALLLASVSAALSFYGCARWLRARWEWAFAGALLFAFALQSFHRGIGHLFLIFSWTVPLALVACGLVAHSRRLRAVGWAGGYCVVTGAVIGMGNPYVLFLFLQLMGWAMIAQWLGPRRRANLVAGGLTLVATLGIFAAVESHLWAFGNETAGSSPLVRSYAGTELYAMKPVELLLPPPGHRWEPLADLGYRYLRWSEMRTGESSMSYLGLFGIVGLVWLAIASLRALLQQRRVPTAAMPTAWIIAFSSLGGVTNIFALLTGLLVFRATSRFSIFISAVVLLFLASRMSRWWVNRPRWLSCSAAAVAAAIGLADQLPRAAGPEWQAEIARGIEADRELGRRVEEKLPPGAMVFQLPVIEFPEANPPHKLEDYEYFRPYLATHSLRFSYGALKRRCRSHWLRELASLSTDELVTKLEQYGFSAVYFHRDAFVDQGERLLEELAVMGRTSRIESKGGKQLVVMLQPVPQPEKPLARRLTFGRGWHSARAGEPRWAYGAATLSYYNPLSDPMTARARFAFTAADDRNVRIWLNNTEVAKTPIGKGRHEVEVELMLAAGVNRIDLRSEEPAVRSNSARNQLRAFGVFEAAVMVDRPYISAQVRQDSASVVSNASAPFPLATNASIPDRR